MKTFFKTALSNRRPGGKALRPPGPLWLALSPTEGWKFRHAIAGLILLARLSANAETLAVPLGFSQSSITYNLQSQRGVPISMTVSNPPGSDGRMTNYNESTAAAIFSQFPTNQFQNFLAMGGGLAQTNWQSRSNSPYLKGTNAFSINVATAMNLPMVKDSSGGYIIQRGAQIGVPYLCRQVSYLFGSVVAVPATDENGVLLTNVVASAYWLPEPFSASNHTNDPFYWSPNAGLVYAVQSGPITITWRKAITYNSTSLPAYTNLNGAASFSTNEGGTIYLLYTGTYVVSGVPCKPLRKMYWTEGSFAGTGKPVQISGRVSAVKVVYNSALPEFVNSNAIVAASTPEVLIPGLTDRTFWFDTQSSTFKARNLEGRLFVELLGDARGDGRTREQLGYELVDVMREPTPADITVELGERLLPPDSGSLSDLTPSPPTDYTSSSFAYEHVVVGAPVDSGAKELYAAKATQNLNDYRMHWLETGLEGLQWPRLYGRYQMIWPTDVQRYSHYVRAWVATEAQALTTAMQLNLQEAPYLQYQDPMDQPRAKLVADGKFYTWIDAAHPAHRTLLRFTIGNAVAFKRVFSWLDVSLKTTNFAGDVVATNLTAWDPTNGIFNWPDLMSTPRIVNQVVNVGDRIFAPDGELGTVTNYLAGHINTALGNSYQPGDYVDPLVSGFDAAKLGAIIPVNAIPGTNYLEVWWFRQDNDNSGFNAGNQQQGFTPTYWPAVIGRYTIQWPTNSPEIVLASKLGSGTLDIYQAAGTIYSQNDPSLPGYNPNEEHAIMSGGAAYATRDDLNITNGSAYSSAPFVLLDYQSNGIPCMKAFKVLREKPEAGYVFDYPVAAGTILQPPPPLMFLAVPIETVGGLTTNYNTEPPQSDGDIPGGWNTDSSPSSAYGHYGRFTYKDRKQKFWVYRGPHAGLPPLAAGTFLAQSNLFVALTNAEAVLNQPFQFTVQASRQAEFLTLIASNLPSWLTISGLSLIGQPGTNDVGTNAIQLVVQDMQDYLTVTNMLTLRVAGTNGTLATQGPITIVCSNQYSGTVVTYSNRAAFLAVSPTASNSFTMRFYYKTEASFAWPGVASPPAAGSIVPYLRPVTNGSAYVGNGQAKTDRALDIVYRPYWPERDPSDATKAIPIMPYGYTLTKPVSQPAVLPGIRDWKTAFVLYQQSSAVNITQTNPAVVLHDPTRQKTAALTNFGLQKLPSGVNSEYYQGKYYFPNLPPHLGKRLYFDPNLGSKGSLVLNGVFVNETIGESYLRLNVLSGLDLASAIGLCPVSEGDYQSWSNAVAGLSTRLETFYENPNQPGTYIANSNWTTTNTVGVLAEITSDNLAVDSYALSATGPGNGYVTLLENSGTAFTQAGDPVAMHIIRVGGSLYNGSIKVLAAENPLSEKTTLQHTLDLAGRFDEYEYEWKIAAPADGVPPGTDINMSQYLSLVSGTNLPCYVLGGAGVEALGDNYLVMRFRPMNTSHPLYNQWSDWSSPQLVEGWIKRVLAGINPFNQRATDLFNNSVNTDVSLISQAGKRWEGAVALNSSTINDYGLIEIYETILRRGRALSIESGYNYGPANDALLLAAGYLSDLYMMVGNEAWADAANPTIGIGTADHTYGDIATALFAFKGQEPSLLEEELALLRGRDDFLQPGCTVAPIYNRLVWNYTRGIDAGEVIYALNYNIQPSPKNSTAIIGANDAAYMYPQGHGDAYGHYLTALKGYYSLLLNSCFDWVPRSEAVLVLGQPVQVDYQDERKFAVAAAAVARAGQQVFDLTWRRDYQSIRTSGWGQFGYVRVNPRQSYVSGLVTTNTASYWSLDHWATRTGEGGYINWVVGNAILPDVDNNANHTGIQKVDRTTVPELQELVTLAKAIQTDMDSAEGGLSPLGVPQDAIAFDINPAVVVGTDGGTHFEQIYQRAKVALNNAVAAFNDAKGVTALMRSEQDSLTALQNSFASQEQAYNNVLIENYGTPYPDDLGAGKTYIQSYAGPDLIHYTYVDLPESTFSGLLTPQQSQTNRIDLQQFPSDWATQFYTNMDWVTASTNANYANPVNSIQLVLGPHGFFDKPQTWIGKRQSPGKIQQRISEYIASHDRLAQALSDAEGAKADLDKQIAAFNAGVATHDANHDLQVTMLALDEANAWVQYASGVSSKVLQAYKDLVEKSSDAGAEAIPKVLIGGVAVGTDAAGNAIAASLKLTGVIAGGNLNAADIIQSSIAAALAAATASDDRWKQYTMANNQWLADLRNSVQTVAGSLATLQGNLTTINTRLREFDDAQRAYQAAVAAGDRILSERTVYRAHVAQVIQGYRTRDAGFRIFRNEKLERYKTLFDLSARYALLAANAYDYETGLLNTSAGQAYLARIINSRALGVVRNGEPQYAGSDTGDPGLSSALAEMKADWDVLRGRLGFNNPDAYGTTVSLRSEALRILPGTEGNSTWQDALQAARVNDILADADVRRYCMQIDNGSGLAVPGIVLTFSTTIARGYNLFGQPLAAGDHAYSDSSFATKIFGAGVAFVGYIGMDNPSANSGSVAASGGTSPSDPGITFLDSLGLAATPYIYLIPVGVDSMRSPPLGDSSTIRTWSVNDVAIPMPFNIGASDFSTKQLWQSSDSLSEVIFTLRKHQAFRPVSDTSVFSSNLYGSTGTLKRSQYTNNRLVGRSVWNSQWKLVIPGCNLLSDPKEGLDRFIRTVNDVKLHFVTYSYSGN
jgi:hypothetical protein